MPRVPVACAGQCGKMLTSSATSLPPGQRMCRACRAASLSARRAATVCTREDCTNKVKARGLCKNHYDRQITARCTLDGCSNPRHARGMCRTHYRRWARASGLGASPSDAWSESRRSNYHARRARMNGQARNTKVFVSALIERDGTDCSACGQPIRFDLPWPDPHSVSVDHTWPISRGGSHTLDNTTLMCLQCNLRKGNRVTLDDQPTTTPTPGTYPQAA
jgi:5-methylcytosine-specific restriction endonuclease McrA